MAAPEAPDAVEVDYRGYLDQARFFVKRGWYPDAEEQLQLAVAHPDGQLDAAAWFLLAQVRYELADLHGARYAADRAMVNSHDAEQTAQTRQLLSFFSEKFGFVQLQAGQEGAATHLDVALQSTLFDPDLRRFVGQLTERVAAEPTVLPHPLGLPAGRYTINGEPVEVVAGQVVPLSVPLQGTRSLALQTLQLELGAGVSLWLGPQADHLLPAPAAQLSLSLPTGPVVWGAVVDAAPTPWMADSGAVNVGLDAVAAGLRVGFELPDTQPMVFRPSVGWRMGRVPGVERPCSVTGATASCGLDQPGQLHVYLPATAQIPFVELSAHYQDRRKRSSWGAGLKVIGEWGFGTVPASGSVPSADGRAFEYSVTDRAWSSPGLRVLADLSFAF
jgi:hypothetical protein